MSPNPGGISRGNHGRDTQGEILAVLANGPLTVASIADRLSAPPLTRNTVRNNLLALAHRRLVRERPTNGRASIWERVDS